MKFYSNAVLCGCLFLVCYLYPVQQPISNPFNIKQIPHYSSLRCFFPVKNYSKVVAMTCYVLLSASFACLEASTIYLDPNVREAIMLDRTMNEETVPFNELIRVIFDYNKWLEDFSHYINSHIKNRIHTNQ